ncbi:MAG: glycosyltransferase family 1 protein [Parcubacteria group bacterium]|jgi:glycosyltransferase involved in cell wall biosynthesis
MRIGIDARFYGSIGKGLGRYTQKLIENLEVVSAQGGRDFSWAKHNQYFIFLRRGNWEEYQPHNPNFTKVLADIPWYSVREQIALPKILSKYNLDLVHFPHFNVPLRWKGKFVVTIHDLILFHYPTRRASTLSPIIYLLKKNAYHRVIKNAIEKSERIISVSEHTKRDILKHFRVGPEKVCVTYEAADIRQNAISTMPAEILSKYGIIKPYALYVGNAYPHKNLERLVLAFKHVLQSHPHLKLVLVGKEDYFYKRLKIFVKKNETRNIIFTDFVSDEELSMIYREALLYVFPSLYEGFGLPPLEAMAKNIPVACSDIGCLREILGNAAYYFNPKGVSEMADAIKKVATENELRDILIRNGGIRARAFSWHDLAKNTLQIYKETIKHTRLT